jgi:hypothetical protein
MNIRISLSAVGITTNNLRVVIYEAANPSTEVDSQLFAPPHTLHNIVFSGVNDVLHIVRVYETATSSGGTLRNEFYYDPSTGASGNSVINRADEFLEVDVTTGLVGGTTSYGDSSLSGWAYSVERRATMGTMRPGDDLSFKTAGGFDLLKAGDAFYTHEIFVLHFQPQLSVSAGGSSGGSGKLWTANDTITATVSLDATAMQKMYAIEGSDSTAPVITLPDLGGVVDNKLIFFNSDGGSHKNAVLKAFGVNVIKYKGADATEVILGQGERLAAYKYGGKWNLFNCDVFFNGIELFYSAATDLVNTLPCNGQELQRAVYPRLWAAIQQLPTALILSETAWLATNGKYNFGSGNGTTTFRIPDLREMYIRGASAARAAGSFQLSQVGKHRHRIKVWADDPVNSYGHETVAPTKMEDFTIAATNKTEVETTDFNDTASTTDLENRTDNIAEYILIRI